MEEIGREIDEDPWHCCTCIDLSLFMRGGTIAAQSSGTPTPKRHNG